MTNRATFESEAHSDQSTDHRVAAGYREVKLRRI